MPDFGNTLESSYRTNTTPITGGLSLGNNAIGNTIGNLGQAIGNGFAKKGPTYMGRVGSSDGYNQTSYQNYSNMNDLVNQWNKDNANQYVQDATGSWTDFYKGGRSRSGKSKNDTFSVGYGIKNDTGNQAVDQYANYLLGGGTQNANDWLTGQRSAYTTGMQNAAKSAVNNYMDPFISGQQDSINAAQQSAFDEAKAKLDRQKAYGYLSDLGYQKALDKLNTQTGSVRSNMNDVYNAQLNNWSNNLNDMYQKAINGAGAWDFVNPFDREGSDYYRQNQLAQNYAQNSMNQDIMNSLLADANTYTPEQWIAYGAGEQGAYNPFADFTSGTRRKKTTSTEGINEV